MRRTRLFRQLPFYLMVTLILGYIIFPIYWMVISSFRPPGRLFAVEYWPTEINLINYRFLTVNDDLLYGLYNSIIVSLSVAVLTLVIGACAAYALGRLHFRGRTMLRYGILALTAFPAISIVGGLYLLVINPCVIFGGACPQLQLYNTRTALVITYLILTLPLTVWFLTSYFKNLPVDLEDAAYVDGATPFQTFIYIFLPLAAPALLTTGLLAFIISWGEFLFALTFTIDDSAITAPIALSRYGLGQGSSALAAAVLLTVPVVLLPFTFRHQLTSGLTGLISSHLAEDASVLGWWQRQWLKWGGSPITLSTSERILLFLLGLGTLSFLTYGWTVIPFVYSVDYGEGPLLDQAVRLANFQNIYRPDLSHPPYTITNYPPLYILLQVPFVWLFGPAYWYGRLISWLSISAAATFLGLMLLTFTRSRLAALIGALTLLTMPYVAVWAPLYRIDSLALGLSLAGLFFIVRWPQARWSLLITALLLTAAVYTRQSYGLAAPLAAFVWLLSQRPRYRAFVFGAVMAGLGLSLLVLLNFLTNGGFFFNIVTANINEFQLDLLTDYINEVTLRLPGLLLIATGFVLVGGWLRLDGWWLIAPYVVGATLSALTIGKIGSNVNYLLEFSAALSLVMGVAIIQVRSRPLLQAGFGLILALQVFLLLPGSINHWFIESKVNQIAEHDQLLTLIKQAEGQVLTDEHMGLLPLVGQPLYLQPFEVTQLARDGVWDQGPFLRSLEQQEFALILIFRVTGFDLVEERWTPEMLDYIERHYYSSERIGNQFDFVEVYRPRG